MADLGLCPAAFFHLGNGFAAHFKRRPTDPDSALDVDYLIENNWFVGSPATVTGKLQALQQATGGFGGLLVMVYDFSTEPEWWQHSLELLVHEVMPRFR